VQPRRLLRSDTLAGISPADGRTLIDDYGLTTIVDLRDVEESALEEPLPAELDSVLLYRASLLLRPPTRRGEAEQTNTGLNPGMNQTGRSPYWRYLTERPESIVTALRFVAGAEGATLVNCAAGKDRTGLLIAVILAEVGVDEQTILADYLASGSRIEALLARLSTTSTYRDSLAHRSVESYRPKARFLTNVLAGLRSQPGGVSGWLALYGWNHDDHDALCSKLLDATAHRRTDATAHRRTDATAHCRT
jgi:protein tyrosine/serine phosphatase